MACISPDGKPTQLGEKMLRTLISGPRSPEQVAETTNLPLFRVRNGFRELIQAGLVSQHGDFYDLTPKGFQLLKI